MKNVFKQVATVKVKDGVRMDCIWIFLSSLIWFECFDME